MVPLSVDLIAADGALAFVVMLVDVFERAVMAAGFAAGSSLTVVVAVLEGSDPVGH